MSVVVLVHGSWHGAWCWRRLEAVLRDQGHEVFAPTLSGCAERHDPLDQSVALGTHVEDVAKFLFYEDLENVFLVGHSSAGMILPGVSNTVPERIRALIYLDAYVVPPGKKGFDLWTAERVAKARQAIVNGNPFRTPFTPDFLGISDPELSKWTSARLTPHPLATYDAVIPQETPAAAAIPRLYVQCLEGPIAPVFAPIFETVRGWGWPTKSVPWPHDCMLTHPRELAVLIDGYARERAGNSVERAQERATS